MLPLKKTSLVDPVLHSTVISFRFKKELKLFRMKGLILLTYQEMSYYGESNEQKQCTT